MSDVVRLSRASQPFLVDNRDKEREKTKNSRLIGDESEKKKSELI